MCNKNIIILLIYALAIPISVFGVTYNLTSPLPGGTAQIETNEAGFIKYAGQMFWFLLSAAIILALVMMVIGGVEYVGAAGNTSFLGDAKDRIINALLGLVLALAAWLILNTINPELVNFQLTVPKIPNTGGPSSALPSAPSIPPPLGTSPVENPPVVPTLGFKSICEGTVPACHQGTTAQDALLNCQAHCDPDDRCTTPVHGTC